MIRFKGIVRLWSGNLYSQGSYKDNFWNFAGATSDYGLKLNGVYATRYSRAVSKNKVNVSDYESLNLHVHYSASRWFSCVWNF